MNSCQNQIIELRKEITNYKSENSGLKIEYQNIVKEYSDYQLKSQAEIKSLKYRINSLVF